MLLVICLIFEKHLVIQPLKMFLFFLHQKFICKGSSGSCPKIWSCNGMKLQWNEVAMEWIAMEWIAMKWSCNGMKLQWNEVAMEWIAMEWIAMEWSCHGMNCNRMNYNGMKLQCNEIAMGWSCNGMKLPWNEVLSVDYLNSINFCATLADMQKVIPFHANRYKQIILNSKTPSSCIAPHLQLHLLLLFCF